MSDVAAFRHDRPMPILPSREVNRIAAAICDGRDSDARNELFFNEQSFKARSAREVALLAIDVAHELFVREGEATRSWHYEDQVRRVRAICDPQFVGRVTHPNGSETDDRFGWIGDMHSGTLLCQWPGCGAEVYTETYKIDEAADNHWKDHL